jgi:hypothetical protein
VHLRRTRQHQGQEERGVHVDITQLPVDTTSAGGGCVATQSA